MMVLYEVEEFTGRLLEAFTRLIPQLDSFATIPDEQHLRKIIESDVATIIIAEVEGRIIGTLTLLVFQIPTGLRAWIEDVVVDKNFRGAGVGEALNRKALSLAKEKNVTMVQLTSIPNRKAATRLYKRIGFKPLATKLYHYSLD
jgi:GNAT superfamily N-acetyltransferase